MRTQAAYLLVALTLASCSARRQSVRPRSSLRVELSSDQLRAEGVGIAVEILGNRLRVPEAPFGSALVWNGTLGRQSRDVSFQAIEFAADAGALAVHVDGQKLTGCRPPVSIEGPPVTQVTAPPRPFLSVLGRGAAMVLTLGLCLLLDSSEDAQDVPCLHYR